MIMQASAATDVGLRRRENEDRYALVPSLGLYLVADGMGGHRAGQMASQLAAEASVRAVQALEGAAVSLSEKLRQVVACANREIFTTAQSHPELKGMGTTFVAILASKGRVALAHVGDSRAYRLRNGELTQLTDDHSVVGELVRQGQLTSEEARVHPQSNEILRAIGTQSEVEVDLQEISVAPGDLYMLCSDGLSGMLPDQQIAEVLPTERPDDAVRILIERANLAGGTDNITVQIGAIDDFTPIRQSDPSRAQGSAIDNAIDNAHLPFRQLVESYKKSKVLGVETSGIHGRSNPKHT